MSKRFPGSKLSWFRLSLAVVVAAALLGAGVVGWKNYTDAKTASGTPSVFTGYVDVTVTPRYSFESPVSDDAKSVVLSFVVADPKAACQPSWGGAYSMDAAASGLDLDRRIARLRQVGGNVAVSFGGQANHELASVCTDPTQLRSAYASVVERYDLSTIDLDVEGAALSNQAGVQRQAKAIAALQKDRQTAGKPLAVWLTLPVAPTGLTNEGKYAVQEMLAAGVDLAGVNIMTMDYGASRVAGQSMLEASEAAATATHQQLATLYSAAHQNLGTQTLWRKLGLTPMIGQNDVAADVFSIADAAALHDFGVKNGIGRMSMWSLNRDAECGPNYPDLVVVSNLCSGVSQRTTTFSTTFAKALSRGLDAVAPNLTAEPKSTSTATATAPADNPSTSPYPIWSALGPYVAGDRIVWHGNVYEAKWWTKNDVPDNPMGVGDATPWKLIGPVLPGDKPTPDVVVPAGTYPEWSAATVYHQGDRVMLGGRVFEAKWWVQAESPEASLEGSTGSAWQKVSNDELTKLLATKATK